jgi:hypothetical protein
MESKIKTNQMFVLNKRKIFFFSYGNLSSHFNRIGFLEKDDEVLVLAANKWEMDPFYTYIQVLSKLGIGWLEGELEHGGAWTYRGA